MNQDKYLIPLALVVAGALVAGAVFFKSGSTSTPDDEINPDDISISEVTSSDHILGNPNADVLIVEYSDIDCPFCSTFHGTMNQIIGEYGKDGRVAWVFRNFPLDQLHPDARYKAESAECVASLAGNDVYWQYLDALFEREDETRESLVTIAATFGVNQGALQACLDEGRFTDKVQAQYEEALDAGGRGTPYSLIVAPDGELFPINGAQPYSVVKQVIDTILTSTQ